jgi:hypothetical protein
VDCGSTTCSPSVEDFHTLGCTVCQSVSSPEDALIEPQLLQAQLVKVVKRDLPAWNNTVNKLCKEETVKVMKWLKVLMEFYIRSVTLVE